MAVAVSDFVINNEMQSLEDEKYLLMKKKLLVYSFKKKTGMFPLTWSQSQCISYYGAFHNFSVFQQYKKQSFCNS